MPDAKTPSNDPTLDTSLAQPVPQSSPTTYVPTEYVKSTVVPRQGFINSIFAGLSQVIDAIWSGAARLITTFKDLTQGQAVTAIMGIVLVLGAMGATTAVAVMGYVCYAVVNRPSTEADANAALLRYMNERDDRAATERDLREERTKRYEERREARESERDRQVGKFVTDVGQLKQSIDRQTTTNEKVVFELSRMNNKLPDPMAPTPKEKPPIPAIGEDSR